MGARIVTPSPPGGASAVGSELAAVGEPAVGGEPAAWFPICFLRDLPRARLRRFTLHGQGHVLLRDGDDVHCHVDRCPHRAARLSDGRVVGDTIECLYHGWRFARDGACVAIPQLPEQLGIPATACLQRRDVQVRQGMVFVWFGETPADADAVPTIPALDGDVHSVDYTIDLPYDRDALIENVVDLAHIHIAHHGVRGGGIRRLAGPIDFEIDDLPDGGGFTASFRTRLDAAQGPSTGASLTGARMSFRAPGLVHYESRYRDPALCSGLALYAVPIDRDRCRLLYRAYSSFPDAAAVRRPRWREHLFQNRLLEQDMAVVAGQAEDSRRDGRALREQWLPLKTSDALVIRFRRWIDDLGAARGDRLGFVAEPPPPRRGACDSPAGAELRDRLHMHTTQCVDCSAALEHHRVVERRAQAIGFGALCAAVVAAGFGLAVSTLALTAVAVAMRVVAHRARRVTGELTGVHPPEFVAPPAP
ncbi:MAG: aromatic ring-hydroxylating dioxygenase subunit alpha [Planctomycetes bacterium]|nr:aromatic ring-hydroxylating dioxygenase subunit alpha [Planctomycetota bacterium]